MSPSLSSTALIAERIRNQRLRLGLSQSQVAEQAGVTTQAISLWENGKTSPGGSNIAALAKALQCDISWLIEGQSDEDRIKELIENKGKTQQSSNNEAKSDELVDKQVNTLRNFISENEITDTSLTGDLYHLVQLFADLDSKRRAEVLRLAIEQWKESKMQELEKYDDLYNKLK